MLADYLGDAGIAVDCVYDGEAALAVARRSVHELLILDVMLPGRNGFDVLRSLRRDSQLPVLMLTAQGDDTDRIVGLELGADDYLPKPFNPRELLARVRAVLRRSEGADSGPRGLIDYGQLEIDMRRQQARFGGAELVLTAAELRLLELLARQPGELVSRDRLSEYGLGRPYRPPDRSVDTHISNLRRKLEAAGAAAPDIRGVRNRGYLLADGDYTRGADKP